MTKDTEHSSQTPRTDELLDRFNFNHRIGAINELAEHARQLERELAAARQELQLLMLDRDSWAEQCKQAEQRLAEAKEWLETERMRLAGCSSAALGYYKRGDSIHPDYKSASLDDVVTLYEKYQQAEQQRDEVKRELEEEKQLNIKNELAHVRCVENEAQEKK